MDKEDQPIIDSVVHFLRSSKACGKRKIKIGHEQISGPYTKEMDILTSTLNGAILVIEVKTKQKRSDPADKFSIAINQLKIDEVFLINNLKIVLQQLFFSSNLSKSDLLRRNPRIIYGFIYYNWSTKGQSDDERIYVLNKKPSSRIKLKDKSDLDKHVLISQKYSDFVKDPWSFIDSL